MTKKSILLLFFCVCFLSSCSLFPIIKKTPPSTAKNPPISKINITGVIRRLNLPTDLVSQNNWQDAQYLLEEFPTKNNQPIYYALFSNPNQPLSQYLNTCVEVTGTLLDNKKMSSSPYSKLIPIQFSSILDKKSCQIYPISVGKIYQEKISLKGQINSQFRPLFNLPYDYFFTSQKPFETILLNGQKQNLTQIIAIPEDDKIWTQINQFLKKNVTVTGSLILGDNDNQLLQITSILPN